MTDGQKVKMYTAQYCPYCMMARSLLEDKGVPYEDLRVDGDRALRMEMESLSGRRTVPQIFVGTKHIGGFDDMYTLEKTGHLDLLLGTCLG